MIKNKIQLIYLLPFCLLISCNTTTDVLDENKEKAAVSLILEDDFEKGIDRFSISGNPPEVVQDVSATSENYVLKSQLTNKSENKYRTELSLNKQGLIFEIDKDYWVGMRIKLDEDFEDFSDFYDTAMVMQLHYFDWDKEIRSGQPFVLRFNKDQILIQCESIRVDKDPNDVIRPRPSITLWTGVPAYSVWEDWVFHLKLSDMSGVIDVWRNGKQILAWSGDNHINANPEGSFMKFGLYSSQYKDETKRLADGDTRTVYHDQIRVAGSDGNYAIVAPR